VAVRPETLFEAVKVTWTVQAPPGAIVWDAQVPPVVANSPAFGPEIARAGTVPAKVPTLRNMKVRDCVAGEALGEAIEKTPDGSASNAQKATKPPIAPDRGWTGWFAARMTSGADTSPRLSDARGATCTAQDRPGGRAWIQPSETMRKAPGDAPARAADPVRSGEVAQPTLVSTTVCAVPSKGVSVGERMS